MRMVTEDFECIKTETMEHCISIPEQARVKETNHRSVTYIKQNQKSNIYTLLQRGILSGRCNAWITS